MCFVGALQVSPSHSESSLPKVVSREVPEARLAVSTQFKAQVSYISEILAEILPEYNSSFLITMALRIVITDTQIKTVRRSGDPFAGCRSSSYHTGFQNVVLTPSP